jgi:hypothetical protein
MNWQTKNGQPRNQNSIPNNGNLHLSSLQHPDMFMSPPSLLHIAYRELYSEGKAAGAGR